MLSLANSHCINDASSAQTELTASGRVRSIPVPYGAISKRTKKKQKSSTLPTNSKQQRSSTAHRKKKDSVTSLSASASSTTTTTTTPYPFFTPASSSFFSLIADKLFHNLISFNGGGTKNPSSGYVNGISATNATGPVGFMPCTSTHTNKTQTSDLEIIIPITTSSPIDCHYYSHCHYSNSTSDNCSLSSSSSSSFSSKSSNSTSSTSDSGDIANHAEDSGPMPSPSPSPASPTSPPSFSYYMDDARAYVRNGLKENIYQSRLDADTNTHISTTTLLSDILCDHYVQTQINTASPSLPNGGAAGESIYSADDVIDVPLETFCIYEAPFEECEAEAIITTELMGSDNPTCGNDDQLSRMRDYLLPTTEFEQTKEWTLVETLSKTKRAMRAIAKKQQENLAEEDDIENQETVAIASTTTIVVSDDDSDEDVEDSQALSLPQVASSKDNRSLFSTTITKKKNQKSYYFQQYHHRRDIRANAAYLRMIVAEVNMMRSQKIVGPLRQRRILPKRTDRFIRRPSPLQLIMI